MEIIEYKSPGHPDTLTDLIVEECATYLDKYYLSIYNKVLHYNVDKAVFLAGNAKIDFKEWKIIKPPCFILGGQVSRIIKDLKVGLIDIIEETIKKYLPNLKQFKIEIRCNNVVQNLSNIAESETILANDTSFGVGYYPYSKAELKVFAIKKELDKMIAEQIIPIGELYKIMYTPKTISISAPLYVQRVHNRKEYTNYKKRIEKKLSKYGKIIFNPDFENGFPYLTITGSSIECGDDGQVGRGNRYNGLITPCKPMTMEAYCGKNNKNHVGKLYQKLAFERAKEIYEKTHKYTEIILVSKIGRPITDYEEYIK
jgi:S-adenosylmethionine synthetase